MSEIVHAQPWFYNTSVLSNSREKCKFPGPCLNFNPRSCWYVPYGFFLMKDSSVIPYTGTGNFCDYPKLYPTRIGQNLASTWECSTVTSGVRNQWVALLFWAHFHEIYAICQSEGKIRAWNFPYHFAFCATSVPQNAKITRKIPSCGVNGCADDKSGMVPAPLTDVYRMKGVAKSMSSSLICIILLILCDLFSPIITNTNITWHYDVSFLPVPPRVRRRHYRYLPQTALVTCSVGTLSKGHHPQTVKCHW